MEGGGETRPLTDTTSELIEDQFLPPDCYTCAVESVVKDRRYVDELVWFKNNTYAPLNYNGIEVPYSARCRKHQKPGLQPTARKFYRP